MLSNLRSYQFILLSLILVLLSTKIEAQSEESSSLVFENLKELRISEKNNHSYKYKNDIVGLINVETKENLSNLVEKGVEVLEVRSSNLYLVRIPSSIKAAALQADGIKNVAVVPQQIKLSPSILNQDIPSWASHSSQISTYSIVFHQFVSKKEIYKILEEYNAEIQTIHHIGKTVIIANVENKSLNRLSQQASIAHIDFVQSPDEPMMLDAKQTSGAHFLNAKFSGGKNLNGQGVVIGIGDGGELGNHIDFNGRIINYANGTYTSYGTHPDQVSGVVGGGGHLNPDNKGYAPEAQLLTEKTSRIINNARIYYEDEEMVVTNNSYGASFSCSTAGQYNYTSQTLDWQMQEYDRMIHVFAAGNSAGSACNSYPTGYNTILRSYASAKNVLTAGVADFKKDIWAGSSMGPVQDGRLKPEIIGVAQDVWSPARNYDYGLFGATSSGTASVSGAAALVHQRYKELNTGDKPSGAMVKAILCNTADDHGNPGPDFQYGFGVMNVRKAVELVESGNYTSNTIRNKQSKTIPLTLNGNKEKIKIMLYWHDKESVPYPENKALINDLDIEVISPDGSTTYPLILNPAPSTVQNDAIQGVDTLNNIEQVVIENPSAGNYSIVVKGTDVAVGTQDFVVVWEVEEKGLVLTHPFSETSLEPNTTTLITWDASSSIGNLTLEYSADGGTVWNEIGTASAQLGYYEWLVPNILSENVLVRLSSGTVQVQNTAPFYILKRPENFEIESICDGSLRLQWDAVDYASEYEIYKMGVSSMEMIGSTTDSEIIVDNLILGTEYWFSIAAKSENGKLAKRNIAKRGISTHDALCSWENDASLRQIIASEIGRELTSTALSSTETIQVVVKNIGTNTIENIPVFYAVNGNVTAEVAPFSLARGEEQVYTFNTKADFSKVGNYELSAWVEYPSDTHSETDTIGGKMVYQLGNPLVTLPYYIDFENAVEQVYSETTMGVTGEEETDFKTDSGTIQIRKNTTENTESSGNKVLEVFPSTANTTNEVIFTVNLSELSNKEVLLQFDSKYNSINENSTDKVFVRGADTDEWIELYTVPVKNTWSTTEYLYVSYHLADNNQSLSSSFQLKFEHNELNILSLDNINFYDAAKVLPVEMTSFTATKRGTDVLLKWETASEINNDYFEVQVAKGTEDFQAGEYETLGQVQGNGTTSDAQTYVFGDASKFKTGVRYYRLKQVDFDGTFEYSQVIPVHFGDLENRTRIFPNPFTEDRFYIHFDEEEAQELTLVVYNAFGFEVKRIESTIPEGETTLVVKLDKSLPSGTYVIQAQTGRKTHSYKLMKQLW